MTMEKSPLVATGAVVPPGLLARVRHVCNRSAGPGIVVASFTLFFVIILAWHNGHGVSLPHSFVPVGSPASKAIPNTAGLSHRPFQLPKPVISKAPVVFSPNPALLERHHIHELVDDANKTYTKLAAQATNGSAAAAAAYRTRRGRHPPPGFDKWVKYAEEKKSVMIEDFFDRMHADLEQFWAIPADEIRRESARFPNIISIRSGSVDVFKMSESPQRWLERYKDMIGRLPVADLPDVDLAFNPDEEPHIFIPYEEGYNRTLLADMSKHVVVPNASYPIFDDFESLEETPQEPRTWEGFRDGLIKGARETWYFARAACPPDSPVGRKAIDGDERTRPDFPDLGNQVYTKYGYIKDFHMSKSPCYNPDLRNSHGYFLYPRETSYLATAKFPLQRALTRRPFPLLSGSKIDGVHGEILVPAAINWYLQDEVEDVFEFKNEKAQPWNEKESKISWRGLASGGFATKDNWRRFPRYRLVSMLNATHMAIAAKALAGNTQDWMHNRDRGADFPFPDVDLYQMTTTSLESFIDWVRDIADAVFTMAPVGCWPVGATKKDCDFAESKYEVQAKIPPLDFFKSRFLPDVDSGAASPRFRSLMMSNSVPIKSTIWSEWHDSRLVPWKHFVPMDNSMGDLWGILDFFVGHGTGGQVRADREAVGKNIALQGRQWAEKVLRRQDMEVWMYRLILELARLGDEKRELMGYTADLVGEMAPSDSAVLEQEDGGGQAGGDTKPI